jgi:alpha-beta hydrolase superfamily lysophospholipase
MSERGLRLIRRALLHISVAVLGLVVGVAAFYIYMVRSGPPLELWHTVELASEFDVGRRDEVQSFGDYLALEDRLFAELDEKVYARTSTGLGMALARYSAGSLPDPRRFATNWNRSFELSAEPSRGGVLLLHGMSDSPYSLRALGQALNARGFWVLGLRLPGHGTAPSGLTKATWEDMSAAVSLAARHLVDVAGDSIHIVGYSTGAPLALRHALDAMDGAESPLPSSLVLISPAVAITPAAAGASVLALLSRIPGLEKLAWTQILPEFDPFKYNSFATNAGVQVFRLTRNLAVEIEERSLDGPIEGFPPTLAFLSTVDATVSADAVIDNLLEHLASGGNELVLFDVNRSRVQSSLLVSDPGPLTARLLLDDTLPFTLTVVGNETPFSGRVNTRRKAPLARAIATMPLGMTWPRGAISLSHVALPFPLDDPLYGVRSKDAGDALHLGQLAFQGERGLLKIPADWLLRLRHNPFYDFLERRSLAWVEGSSLGGLP